MRYVSPLKDYLPEVSTAELRWLHASEKIPNISSNDFEILRQVRQIETAITRAHAGKRPNPESWGALRASEFIVVVRDVATFMMTNFGEKRLAPIGLADTHQLSKLAPQGSFRTHETLYHGWRDDVGPSFLNRSADVAFTRTILFWVREIMHRHSGRPWLNYDARHGRIRRQARILERQCSRGLEWLSERMRDWPDQYRETWWAGARLVGIPT